MSITRTRAISLVRFFFEKEMNKIADTTKQSNEPQAVSARLRL